MPGVVRRFHMAHGPGTTIRNAPRDSRADHRKIRRLRRSFRGTRDPRRILAPSNFGVDQLLFVDRLAFFPYPNRGLAAIFSSDSFGAIVLRRLLPAAFLVPIVIGWFRMEGQKAGWYGTEFGRALMVTVNVMIFSVAVYLSGKEIDRIVIARQEAESALRTSFDYRDSSPSRSGLWDSDRLAQK
jgi:hypothetical protein